MPSSRTRFRLALAGIALLLFATGGLVVRGFSRRVTNALNPAGGTPSRGGSARSGTIRSGTMLERVLSSAVRFGSLEYQGGTSARLSRLQIPIGAAATQVVEIPSADLELDVSSMSLKGLMDGAPLARGLLTNRFSMLQLESGATLPINLTAPARSLSNFRTWTMSANFAGQRVLFRPSTFLDSVPVQVSSGKFGYDRGAIRLDGFRLAFGASQLDVNAGISTANGPAVFDPSTISGSFDMLDLLFSKDTVRPKDARGKLAVKLALSGPAERPEVAGDVSGALEVARLPIAKETAGIGERFLNLHFPKVLGRVSGGRDGALLSAELNAGAGFASIVSSLRQFGFAGERARALATVDGSWTAPRVTQSLELTRGVLSYRFGSAGPLAATTAGIEFPYETMRLSTATRQKQLSYHFDTVSPGGGRARFDYELDRAKVPAVSAYGLDADGVDVAPLLSPVFVGALVMRGRLTLKVSGTAARMALIDMKGSGKGRINGFSLDWAGVRGTLEDLDLADLIRSAVVPVVEVDAPSFGREVILNLKGQARGLRLEGMLRINANLGYTGRFDYTFEPSFLSGNAAGEAALMRRAGSGRLAVKVKGQSPGPPTIELVGP